MNPFNKRPAFEALKTNLQIEGVVALVCFAFIFAITLGLKP
jgi:hypothetical protein